MNVLILGASGKVGLVLTHLALAEGFAVSAFVRSPKTFPFTHHNLTLLKGDILNYDEVHEATVAQDIIFSVIGTNSKKPNTILADGMVNIEKAMLANGTKRIIWLSGVGASKTMKQAPFLYRAIMFTLRYRLKHIYHDKSVQEKLLIASKLDWTIIRTVTIVDKPAINKWNIITCKKQKLKNSTITRGDIATFMLTVAKEDLYKQAEVAVSND